jgi:hypothetical protein
MNPHTTRTILAILAAVVAIIAIFVMTREYSDPARALIEPQATSKR